MAGNGRGRVKEGSRMAVVHGVVVDHGLREESGEEAERVAGSIRRMGECQGGRELMIECGEV